MQVNSTDWRNLHQLEKDLARLYLRNFFQPGVSRILSAWCQPYSYSYYCSCANWSQYKGTFLEAKPILVWQEEISDIFVPGGLHDQSAAAHNPLLDIGQTSGYGSLGFGQKRCEEVWSETQDSCYKSTSTCSGKVTASVSESSSVAQ